MRARTPLLALALLLPLAAAAGRSDDPHSEKASAPGRCTHYEALRRPFFGDTHVHTRLSFDAMGQGTRSSPRDAYRFARGELLGIQPFDRQGRARRRIRLRRPLDFAVVTDHSDLLGETHICETPGAAGHDSLICRVVRRWPRLGYFLVNSRIYSMREPERYGFCGEGGRLCIEASRGPWEEVQQAAEEAYDRSTECAFTSFVGYEWTAMPDGANLHRNVIFRNEHVQRLPTTYIETPTEQGLWAALERECLQRDDGCDVLAIPHNSNLSNGALFRIETASGEPIDAAQARRRAALEVLVEVTQHKGDSECRAGGPAADELCGFETLPWTRMQDAPMPWRWAEPAPLSYVREVLAEGLVQHARLGVNPFKLGLIGSTDTHLGAPGLVAEDRFVGHAAGTVSARLEIPALPDDIRFNPGGLAVLWAEENSRDALFDAMRRREAYGTSGPRMRVRFFGGWDYEPAMCEGGDFAEAGYRHGVAMGGELPRRPESPSSGESAPAPRFAVWAMADPGTPERPGAALQRIQIVKASASQGGAVERVYEVAGDPKRASGLDLGTCRSAQADPRQLCGVWSDPDFDADQHALYYARVVEAESCRWNTWACNAAGVDCREGPAPSGPLAACCDPEVPRTIQERAWTSPIWYTPDHRGHTPDPEHPPASGP